MTSRAACCLLMIALVAPAKADDKTTSTNSQRFDALKKLAGDWVAVDKDGKPTDKIMSSFRVTAGGSAVQETLAPGSDHEMVTMYHLDGSDLVLTHYCVLGNQPRLKAEASGGVDRMDFAFVSSTNLKSRDENHMDHATITLLGPDRLQSEWTACQDGKPCHQVKFDLARKPK